MKGSILVKRLNKSGNYSSSIDFDLAFSDEENPKGLFKMGIFPILNSDGNYEMRYMKRKDGYIVFGEGYIMTGSTEQDIDKSFRRHCDKWVPLVQTMVENEEELW